MKKWLKVLGGLVGAVLLTTLVAGAVFAQGPVTDGDGFGRGRGFGMGFLDEDGVRANDRYGTNPEFVDEDGDGLCDVCGALPGEGENRANGWDRGFGLGFVDEDGDGINDRYGTQPEFVDEDGDGLCDTHGVAAGEGAALGYGRRFHTEDDTAQAPMARRGGFGRRAAAQ